MKKLLVLDGISGVPLAHDLHQSFQKAGVNVAYRDLAKLSKVTFYGVRSAWSKLMNRVSKKSEDTFVYFPRCDRKALMALVSEIRPDAILVVGFVYKFIDPGFLRSFAEESQCHLYLYDTDSCNLYSKRREFVFFLERELPIYRKIFSCSRVTAEFFKHTRGLNADFSPFGANFIATPSTSDAEKKQDVVFVGSGDLRRVLLLESITKHVTIFGNRWKRNYPLMSRELIDKVDDRTMWGNELYQLLTSARIVLNITRGPYYAAGTGVNLRIFEALAAGCFLITDYCDEIAELFTIGEEIEAFNGPLELQEKIRFYLEHPEKRIAIAKQGHAAFLKRFTWDARAQEMLQSM